MGFCGLNMVVDTVRHGLGQVWYLIVLIPDLCTLTYFYAIMFGISRFLALTLYARCVRTTNISENAKNRKLWLPW